MENEKTEGTPESFAAHIPYPSPRVRQSSKKPSCTGREVRVWWWSRCQGPKGCSFWCRALAAWPECLSLWEPKGIRFYRHLRLTGALSFPFTVCASVWPSIHVINTFFFFLEYRILFSSFGKQSISLSNVPIENRNERAWFPLRNLKQRVCHFAFTLSHRNIPPPGLRHSHKPEWRQLIIDSLVY